MLFLQPIEIDYLKDLENHGVSLTEYPLLKLLDSFPLYGHKPHTKKFVSLEMHPWVLSLQKALESFVLSEVIMIPLVARQPIKFLIWVYMFKLLVHFKVQLVVKHFLIIALFVEYTLKSISIPKHHRLNMYDPK